MSEYDFLKDEDNIKLVGKISNLIDTQLPDFVKEEGPIFSEFLKLYYRWMESHELTISMVIQDEYHFNLESEQGSFILETSDDLLLEGNRNSSSAYDLNETITGLSSGATGRVDRNTNTASSKIYVTNVTKFGAFVDVGVHQDGLVHISELADCFVKDPSEIVKVQQKVTVTVMDVDARRKRISLSMR